jgi:hypothetical protein
MPNYFLEGESFYVLSKLNSLVRNKKTKTNPESVSSFSLISSVDFYIYFDPDKETIENINHENFIICFLDKNVDLRLDYIKKIKQRSEYFSFDPIPSTDTNSLKTLFKDLNCDVNFLPTKKVALKYKGSKQNYEWLDLCLINDLYVFGDDEIYNIACDSFFDIWKFTDQLWSGDNKCLLQIEYVNDKNFEDYFNRIRETSKDYLDFIQAGTSSFENFKKICTNTSINNYYRFEKIKEKLNQLNPGSELNSIKLIDDCLKNVRLGSSPKLELVKLFFRFKQNVSR